MTTKIIEFSIKIKMNAETPDRRILKFYQRLLEATTESIKAEGLDEFVFWWDSKREQLDTGYQEKP